MNKLMIIGNLVRDPETGTTESGVNWCTVTVAARKRFHKAGEPDAECVRGTAWRALGDSCAKFLGKGKKVCVIGEPRVHAWSQEGGQARGQMEMNADEVEFLNSGSGNAAPTDADVPQAGQETTEERPY